MSGLDARKIGIARVILYVVSLVFSSIVLGLVIDKLDVVVRSVYICWFDINRDSLPCSVGRGVSTATLSVASNLIIQDVLVVAMVYGNCKARKIIRVIILIVAVIMAIIWLLCFGFLAIKWKMVKDLVSPESVPRFIASPAETVLAFSFLNFLVWIAVTVLAAIGIRISDSSPEKSDPSEGSDL